MRYWQIKRCQFYLPKCHLFLVEIAHNLLKSIWGKIKLRLGHVNREISQSEPSRNCSSRILGRPTSFAMRPGPQAEELPAMAWPQLHWRRGCVSGRRWWRIRCASHRQFVAIRIVVWRKREVGKKEKIQFCILKFSFFLEFTRA